MGTKLRISGAMRELLGDDLSGVSINLNATTFLQDFRKIARDLVLLGLLTLGRLEIRYCAIEVLQS